MGDYSLVLTTSAAKELKRLPAAVTIRIVPGIEKLAGNPRPHGCKKLIGGVNEWRIRIGDYRVVYTINDTMRAVEVTRIAHLKEVYES